MYVECLRTESSLFRKNRLLLWHFPHHLRRLFRFVKLIAAIGQGFFSQNIFNKRRIANDGKKHSASAVFFCNMAFLQHLRCGSVIFGISLVIFRSILFIFGISLAISGNGRLFIRQVK